MKNSLLICVFFLSVSMFSQQKQWTLQECVNHALENNITIKQTKNSLLLNDQDIKATRGQFLPSLNGRVSQSINLGTGRDENTGALANQTQHNTSFGIDASQTIFNGFRIKNSYKQSQLIRESNELELNRIKDDISLNVVNAYLNVLFNKENLATAEAQYDFTKKQLNQVKELVDAGVQPRANIYDAEATLSRDLQNVTIAENNLNLARLTLSQLLQVTYQGFDVETIDVNTPSSALLYNDVQPILDYAVENRNEIKVAEKNIENAELSTEIAKSGFLPILTLGYGFSTLATFSNLYSSNSFFNQTIEDNIGHNFRLSANIPIFSRFQNKTAVAKSKIQEENAKLNLEQEKLNLESTIQRVFTDAQAAYRAYEASKASLDSQQLAFNNSQERYNIGSMNSFELEQARIQLINAEASLINTKYDFVFKTKVLDFYLGKPITQ